LPISHFACTTAADWRLPLWLERKTWNSQGGDEKVTVGSAYLSGSLTFNIYTGEKKTCVMKRGGEERERENKEGDTHNRGEIGQSAFEGD
jgi:hypothetical protein